MGDESESAYYSLVICEMQLREGGSGIAQSAIFDAFADVTFVCAKTGIIVKWIRIAIFE